MAKGQVSEEELAKGLKGIGNFGGLTTSRVQRDNPFRDSSLPSPEPVKKIEVVPRQTEKRVAKPAARPVATDREQPIRPVRPQPGEPGKEKMTATRKGDVFEPVTLKLTPEMRDEVVRIARELQRSKTSKGERITANTVMRVAIRLLTQSFKLTGGEVPNSEEELFHALEAQLKFESKPEARLEKL